MARVPDREGGEDATFAPIARPRLTARLSAAARYPLTLLIAPAGYGKSVALRQFLGEVTGATVRFTLHAEHASLLGFLRGFAESLRERAPHAITALAGAYERNTSSPKRDAGLARWMEAHLESFRGIIAIDDFHIAEGDSEVAGFLTSLIERTKERIRWIVASRSTAGLPVGTWLAYRDADAPLDESELKFTLDEARDAARRLKLTIRDDELEALVALTDGWPAAVSFALRTSTHSSELRNVSALTREMIYRLLAEQVYAALDADERALLEVAIALPVIDVRVLERAGFDRAFRVVERLRERTAFIHEESPGVYHCHDLFREFLCHQTALGGKCSQQIAHARAAQALETTGDIEHAIGSYISAGAPADAVRLLERHGFELLERARGDVVGRAIDSLADEVRRENACMLALQGTLQATAGKFSRAESLLRRALARAGSDRDLAAMVSLRLASLLANQGQDVTTLLSALGEDPDQRHARRAEALSLIAAQQAVSGDSARAREVVAKVDVLMEELDSDEVRAKVLHYVGIAFHHLGAAKKAFAALTQSVDLAAELHLYSIGSRAGAVLSNLALHEEDDPRKQLDYAIQAAEAATKAGDAFGLQTALLQILSARMRCGDVTGSIEIEQQLSTTRPSALANRYLTIFRALRLAWEGRFGEAHRLMSPCWSNLSFDADRAYCGSQYALFLALDGQLDRSAAVTKEILELTRPPKSDGLFRSRAIAAARTFCALSEAISGRPTKAQRILGSIGQRADPVIALVVAAADGILGVLHQSERAAGRAPKAADDLAALDHADYALLLRAVERAARCHHARPPEPSLLTRSEIDILRSLADGMTPKDIAVRSGRSVYTVRVHIANVIAKLGCHGRSEAIRAAHRMGLI